MKICKQYPNVLKNNSKATIKPVFRGYFACPIKEIHMHPIGEFEKLVPEFYKKCGDLFDIVIQNGGEILKLNGSSPKKLFYSDMQPWAQDYKVFLEDGTIGSLFLLAEKALLSLSEKLKLNCRQISADFKGGNFFIGKKDNGETFMLLGKKSFFSKGLRTISKDFGIKKENIFPVPQSDFHIDMTLRPLNYPYILVGDEEMLIDILNKSKAADNINFRKSIYKMSEQRQNYQSSERYKSTQEVIGALEMQGFQTICVPGLLGKGDLNFMNAVVHQKENGDLVYITGGNNLFKEFGINFNQIFKKALKKAAPQIKEVIFIEAENPVTSKTIIEESIKNWEGGFHCMCCERPDFELWNKMSGKN